MKRRRDRPIFANPLPPVARLRELLRYDEETGLLYWRVNKGSRAKAGSVAGCPSTDGRRLVMIDGVRYKTARCVWKLMTSRDPRGIVDHFDGDKGNDRWRNLRDTTQRENSINQRIRSDNTSGLRGVRFSKRRKHWVAEIGVRGKTIYLGSYDTPEQASAAYDAASLVHHTGRWFAFGGDFR